MEQNHLLLSLIAALSYFIESIFGFGGTVVFIGIAGLFFDFKELVYISMLVSCVSSATILAQSWRHFNMAHFRRILAVAFPFLVLGTLMISLMGSPWLLKGFAALLICYGLHGLLMPDFRPPRSVKYAFVALGGFVQGVFTTGGPFVLMGYRREFADKTQLKATMAGFFLVCNLWRILQTNLTDGRAIEAIKSYGWIVLPVIGGVLAGHLLHLRLPEKVFQRCLLAGMLMIGCVLMLK